MSTQARVLLAGGRLYRDAVDRKPPLLPYLSAALFAATGTHSVVVLRILAIVAHGCTAALLATECRRRFGRGTALPAAGFYLLASVAMAPTDAQAFNGEAFVALASTAALVTASRRRPLLAGLAIAAALLTRQTALLLVPGIAVAAVRAGGGRPALARLVAPSAVLLPVVAALLGWRDSWFWCLGGASTGYLALPSDMGYALMLARQSALTFLAGSLGLIALLPGAVGRWRCQVDAWIFLAGGAAASLVGLRFFGHYNLQALPALSLVAMAGWSAVPRGAGPALLVALALIPAGFRVQEAAARAGQVLPEESAVATAVRERARSGDRIFVWGHVPELYVWTDRLPATRFLETGFLTGHSGGRPPDQADPKLAVPGAWRMFEDDLRAHPPAVIVDTSPSGLRGGLSYPTSRFPEFDRYLREHYRRSAVVTGFDLYERRSR